jgi:glycosyltransferase involved in cell wall biosynthesis
VSQLAGEFKNQGHNVSVITNRYPRNLKRHEIIDGISVTRMLFPGLYLASLTPNRMAKFVAGLIIGFVNYFRLLLFLKNKRPDIINIHFLGSQSPYAMLASKLLGIRCVVSLHGDDVEGLPHRSKIDIWLFKKVLLSADYVTACSNYLLNEAKKLVPEIESKSTAIWNGINPEEYQNIEPYKHPHPYIFAAGRFVYTKGFDLLLCAYSSLLDEGQKIDLILAGDGPERENLIMQANKLSLPFVIRNSHTHKTDNQKLITILLVFWGRANKDEMKSLMKGCEMVVIPSRKESFGIVALEAFALGKKVVASRTGGLAEIINEGINGYFVETGNAEDLARGIKKAISDSSKSISVDLRENTWNNVSIKYIEIFQEDIESP